MSTLSVTRGPVSSAVHVCGSWVLWGIAADVYVCAFTFQSALIKIGIEPSIFENMSRQSDWGTQGVRDFRMKGLGIPFTLSTLLVRAATGKNWDMAKWLPVEQRLFQLSQNQVEVLVCAIPYWSKTLSLLQREAALSTCGEESDERGQGWAGDGRSPVCVPVHVSVCPPKASLHTFFSEMIW